MKRSQPSRRASPPATKRQYQCEAEVVPGLEQIAADELAERHRSQIQHVTLTPGAVRFFYDGSLRDLLRASTVQAVYLVETFNVPRPRALLGDQNFRVMGRQIEAARQTAGAARFKTLHLSAAGADSPTMQRLKQALADTARLSVNNEQGDLLIRVRPTPEGEGWETLVRLTPRPLATRDWRVCNLEGALNATVAHAMIRLIQPAEDQIFVNVGCGSGTLLIERLRWGRAREVVGIDHDPRILQCAASNISASGYSEEIHLCRGNIQHLPLPENRADTVVADLPFGQRIGSHEDNVAAYPLVLAEAARISKPGALFGVITHEIRLLEELLGNNAHWSVKHCIRITLRGLHPRIYILQRNAP